MLRMFQNTKLFIGNDIFLIALLLDMRFLKYMDDMLGGVLCWQLDHRIKQVLEDGGVQGMHSISTHLFMCTSF